MDTENRIVENKVEELTYALQNALAAAKPK